VDAVVFNCGRDAVADLLSAGLGKDGFEHRRKERGLFAVAGVKQAAARPKAIKPPECAGKSAVQLRPDP